MPFVESRFNCFAVTYILIILGTFGYNWREEILTCNMT